MTTTKKLYIVKDSPRNGEGDEYSTYFLNYEEASNYADYLWNHLTEVESKYRTIDVLYINIPSDLIKDEETLKLFNRFLDSISQNEASDEIDGIIEKIADIEDRGAYGTEYQTKGEM